MDSPTQRLTAALADRYAIERELGSGGMATVYLARDIRHERQVALKVLRPELGAVLGVERFLSEIRVTANLQHPHILPLFDSGRLEGLVFYVMPYIDGESLRQRLDRDKQLGVDEAVRIGVAVASALDYAHRHGVVHRDIKPENILLQDGHPVVADFGIALALSAAGGNRLTETGLSLGTPHYMSPEQATGDRAVDAHSDMYSLGAVIYEMLAGDPPHTGSTVQAVIAKVITDRPQRLSIVRDTVPAHVEAAVFKALAKVPADRFATAAQFAEALQRPGLVTMPTDVVSAAGQTAAFATPVRNRRALVMASVPWILMLAAGGAAAGAWLRPEAAAPPVVRFNVVHTNGRFVDQAGTALAFSHDGSMLVYNGVDSSGRVRFLSRGADQLEPQPIDGTENASSPVLAPDGRQLFFSRAGETWTMPLTGGQPRKVCDVGGASSVNEAGAIVVSASGYLFRCQNGSIPDTLLRPDSGRQNLWPHFLPGGEKLLLTIRDGSEDWLAVMDMGSLRVTRLEERGSNPRWIDAGFVLLGTQEGLVDAVPFDPDRGRVVGGRRSVFNDVVVGTGGAIKMAVSRTGSMVYASGTVEREVVLVDRSGSARRLQLPSQLYATPRFSPDGNRIALNIDSRGTAGDVWIYDLRQGTLSRLTFDDGSDSPAWTRDGRSIVYVTDGNVRGQRPRPMIVAATGGVAPRRIVADSGVPWTTTDVTPDGRWLVTHGNNRGGIRLLPVDTGAEPVTVISTRFVERNGRVSPDGHWIAFEANSSGRFEVYVRSLTGIPGEWQISDAGGVNPVWSPRGGELFYRSPSSMVATQVRAGPPFTVLSRTELFPFSSGVYDVAPDGRSFVIARISSSNSLVAVLHFFEQPEFRH